MTWYSRIFKDIQIINSRIKIEQDHSKQNRKTHYRHFARSFKEVPVLNILDSVSFRKDIVAKQCYSRMTNSKCMDDKVEMSPIPSSTLVTNYSGRIKSRILVTKMGHSLWPNKLELILWSNSHKKILLNDITWLLRNRHDLTEASKDRNFPWIGLQWKSFITRFKDTLLIICCNEFNSFQNTA